MTPKSNSVGALKNPIAMPYDSWTLETIFRAPGKKSTNGGGAFALKYTKETTDDVYQAFDGLNVVVDSESALGGAVHVYLSDGSEALETIKKEERYEKALGSCLLTYDDSDVPNTLRIAYYSDKLVVQINNRVCLKTSKVKLPSNYKVSVNAASGSGNERFELLKLKTYSGVISEILDNDGLSAPQPQVVTEFVQLDNDGEVVDKKVVKQEPETATHHSEPTTHNIKFDSQILHAIESIQKSNDELVENFSSMQSKLLAMSSGSDNGKVDFSYLEEQNKKLKQISNQVSQLSTKLDDVSSRLTTLESNTRLELSKVVGSVNELSAKNIEQLRDNEHSVTELSKKIDFLILSEKDRAKLTPVTDVVHGLKLLIIPVLAVSVALCFFAYRLRHDIKTKLL